jgi:peptidoglycan/xylan/chitin deacetylase (PgdA/CDA1 family)
MLPHTTWRGARNEKTVYLTFDDGPIPEVTPWVVDLLKQKGIQATFFCVGENVAKYPEVFQLLTESGQQVGNHTYNHLPAWKCSGKKYFENISKCSEWVKSDLFRPPHGQFYPWYGWRLKRVFKKIVMWDVLSKDYHPTLSAEEVFRNVMKHVRPGSVIVFHDSLKAWPRLKDALPRTLDALLRKGYQFKKL